MTSFRPPATTGRTPSGEAGAPTSPLRAPTPTTNHSPPPSPVAGRPPPSATAYQLSAPGSGSPWAFCSTTQPDTNASMTNPHHRRLPVRPDHVPYAPCGPGARELQPPDEPQERPTACQM